MRQRLALQRVDPLFQKHRVRRHPSSGIAVVLLCFAAVNVSHAGQQDPAPATPGPLIDAASVSYRRAAPDAVPRSAAGRLQETVSIQDFGAVPDGRTDSTTAIANAFRYANSHAGTTVHVPCGPGGNSYLIRAPLELPSRTIIRGDGRSCQIAYRPPTDPGTVAAAFNGIGANGLQIEHLQLFSASSSYPPNAVLILGRIANNAAASGKFEDVFIKGYANRALVYSISYENAAWLAPHFEIDGGTAGTIFYTAAKDYLGICEPACNGSPKQANSNLSLYMSDYIFVVGGDSKANAVTDIRDGGTGDHFFRDGYIGLAPGTVGDGFNIVSGTGGPGSDVRIHGVRIENGNYAVHFTVGAGEGHIYLIDLNGINSANANHTPFYADTGTTLYSCRMEGNLANGARTAMSSFDAVKESWINESYGPIVFRKASALNHLFSEGNIGWPANPGFVFLGTEDEDTIAIAQPNSSSVTVPGTLHLRPAGTGPRSAWGASLNLPPGQLEACRSIGDICGSADGPAYADGAAVRRFLLGAGTAATSEVIGGRTLSAGACMSGTVPVPNATASMAVAVSPATNPGEGVVWQGYVSSNGTVTIEVCAIAPAKPIATRYNVRVIK